MTKVNLGGDRLGSGAKMEVELREFERSTHDLTTVWRSSMAPGTIVPIQTTLGLPGDTHDIEYDVDIQTNPTLGALFGSFKFQIDTFMTPMRLYNGLLMLNESDFDAKKIYWPQFTLKGLQIDDEESPDNQQTSPSSIFAYLGVRGAGRGAIGLQPERAFNAIPWLIYWDVWKNYYANQQETMGVVIHNQTMVNTTIDDVNVIGTSGTHLIMPITGGTPYQLRRNDRMVVNYQAAPAQKDTIILITTDGRQIPAIALFRGVEVVGLTVTYTNQDPQFGGVTLANWRYRDKQDLFLSPPELATFPLKNIDEIRRSIMRSIDDTQAFLIDYTNAAEPMKFALEGDLTYGYSATRTQEGLAVKTYQSDQYQNWLRSEWISGPTGVNALSRVNVAGGYLEIDALNLAEKVYKMLNAVAAADKTYDGYQDAIWNHNRKKMIASPMYLGGLAKEIIFQEVVSTGGATSEEGTDPLGTLVGRGKLNEKHKGGRVSVRVDEPCFITAYASITPRIDYSQGNKWFNNLRTLEELHKPALDQIGFQELITDQMAWWDTISNNEGLQYKSAGKQPAWLNYMTDTNEVLGNFAIEESEMYMVLNRRYEKTPGGGIKDLTTYIDPSKFNHIFAQTSLDAQNFKVQIRKKITSRRKMSAKVMPNL